MKIHTARQIVSALVFRDKEGKFIPPEDPIKANLYGRAKNLLLQYRRRENRNRRLARRSLKRVQ